MTGKERFLRVLRFEGVDRVPNYELGVWGQTRKRWESEGLPPDVIYNWDFFEGCEFFGLERREFVKLNMGPLPPFEEKVIEETDRYIVKQHPIGCITKALKEGTEYGTRLSMDQYIDFPVKDRKSFKELKKRFKPHSPARYPDFWSDRVKQWKMCDVPLTLLQNGAIGFYWRAREWMGTEGLSIAFYEQPKLVEEMMEFIGDFIIETCHKALDDLPFDHFNFSEDLAFKGSTLISPELFKKFIFPHYKRIASFMRDHGVPIISVDSDGYIEPLIPLFLEAGVNLVWPIEVAAGMEPASLRKKYGKNLALIGGIDKRELSKDRASIDRELEKAKRLVDLGGYIPTVDHTIPPEVSYENALYFFEQKRKILEGG